LAISMDVELDLHSKALSWIKPVRASCDTEQHWYHLYDRHGWTTPSLPNIVQ
jgi:hypothetical protein